MALSPFEFVILRCQINRVSQMAEKDWNGDPKSVLPSVDPVMTTDSDVLVDAAAWAVGYVLTMWEVSTLRALKRYPIFNQVYDNVEKFIGNPTLDNLEKYGKEMISLIAAACEVRSIPESCKTFPVKANLAGLVPMDPSIANPSEDPPAPTPPAPRKRLSTRWFGYTMVGGMGLAALGTVGIALLSKSSKQHHHGDDF
jgi:hypothetical protein